MKNRTMIISGYIMMMLATLIPLATFGRMLWQSYSQEERYHSFQKGLSADYVDSIEGKSVQYNNQLNDKNTGIVDPFLGNYETDYGLDLDESYAFGYLSIPSISVIEPVYLGADLQHLAMGLGHVAGTSLPTGKGTERAVVAGHRAEPSHVFFRYLDQIAVGDKLYFDNGKSILIYQMVSNEIISPSEWEKLEPLDGKTMMTLITCDPLPTFHNRLLVHFEFIKSIPSSSLDVSDSEVQIAFTKEAQKNSRASKASLVHIGICVLSIILLLLVIVKFYRFLKN
ncbi:sortase [Streptococcus moroccensis]|uniref:LPXTG-site transpeptidase (Sortase) family protein n=1 Tax=Streptococcus moroccensis TaxID=1451356 RepID=A0ABT9YTW5_9STRE|nr:sortase [Streptococcus moroccensis]MDQ0223437.1 LPXTG-site transpeptidase (sortase) family protein [Streptococcus moroccensis]